MAETPSWTGVQAGGLKSVGAPPPGDADEQAASLRDYWQVVLKRKWLILAFFAGVLAAAAIFTLRQVRIYRATATLVIDLNTPRVLDRQVEDVVDSGTTYWYTKEFFETQYKIIQSRMVSQRVVDRLGLHEDAVFLGTDPAAAGDERDLARKGADPVARLQGKIRVEPVKDSRVVYVHVEDASPDRAALYANTVAEAYIDQNLDRRLDTTRAASEWLEDQLKDLKQRLEKSEVDLYDFKKSNDMLASSLEDKQSVTSTRLMALSDTLTKVRTRKIELEARLRELEKAEKAGLDGVPGGLDSVGPVLASALVQQLKIRLHAIQEEMAEVSGRYLPEHPRYLAVKGRLDELKGSLYNEVMKIVASIRSEYREVSDTERSLVGLVEGTKREAFEINKKEIDYNKFKREEQNNERLYEIVLKRLKEADLSGLLRTNNIRLLDAAQVPKVPARPRVQLILTLAAFFGLFGGLALAFLFEQLDNTMKTQEDIERVGMPFLGIIPSIREEDLRAEAARLGKMPSRDLFIVRKPKSTVAECCRTIRTNVLFAGVAGRRQQRLLVTSSSPQEGKTTVVIQLGITMAQGGAKVVLVDTDMRRPRLHRAFGISNEIGLSSCIVGQASLDAAIKSTEVENLYVLPCGPVPPNPAEILHTDAMREIIKQLEGRFDKIIFDSPPIVAVTDALILAAEADGTLLVVKAGRTPRDVIARTYRGLMDVKAHLLGAVLNDVDLENRKYGYYYYYYYRNYGYYYGDKEAKEKAAAPS